MTDNPISWAILFILAICFAIWFEVKCEEEIKHNKSENDEFFWEYEHNYKK